VESPQEKKIFFRKKLAEDLQRIARPARARPYRIYISIQHQRSKINFPVAFIFSEDLRVLCSR